MQLLGWSLWVCDLGRSQQRHPASRRPHRNAATSDVGGTHRQLSNMGVSVKSRVHNIDSNKLRFSVQGHPQTGLVIHGNSHLSREELTRTFLFVAALVILG